LRGGDENPELSGFIGLGGLRDNPDRRGLANVNPQRRGRVKKSCFYLLDSGNMICRKQKPVQLCLKGMKAYPANVSVTDPITPALDWVKLLLFGPFDLGKWFVIGFCAWLAELGRGGVGSGFHNSFRRADVRHGFDQARDYVMAHWSWILPLAIFVVLALLAIWVLIVWLSSRGRFMFLHCVVHNRGEVSVPWYKFDGQANSLFWFRLGLGLVGLVLVVPLVVLGILMVIKMASAGNPPLSIVMALIAMGMALVTVAIVSWVIAKLTTDFVVPIMFMRGGLWQEAWRELLDLLSANIGRFVLYFLFQIVISIVLLVAIVVVVIATCCVAGCLMALPYVGTVLLLPVLAFTRSYSLFYLAQFGPDYDVFALNDPASPFQTPSGLAGGASA
jgi:hypothetical protein